MNRVVRVLVPLLLAGGGLAGAVLLAVSGSSAQTVPPAASVPLVEVVRAVGGEHTPRLRATGAVTPDQQVTLSAEVSGRLQWVSPKMLPGARVAAGEVLARVDPRDYEAALALEAYNLQQAEVDLRSEQARGAIAAKEWGLLGGDAGDRSLALREPQLLAAQRRLESAQAAYNRARNNLERTSIRAPFAAVVVSESTELGQVVSPAQALATLVGTERLRVTVSVPVEDLALLDVPGVNAERGAKATVTQTLARGAPIVRPGEVLALVGQLDAQTRTAQLVVGVDQPYAAEGLPMLAGAYVEVELEGRPLVGTVAIPRPALTGEDTVWVVEGGGTLRRRTLELAWADPSQVLARAGVADGEEVVTTPLAVAVDGMAVQVAEEAR